MSGVLTLMDYQLMTLLCSFTGADPGFPIGECGPVLGGRLLPMQALFGAPKNFICRSANVLINMTSFVNMINIIRNFQSCKIKLICLKNVLIQDVNLNVQFYYHTPTHAGIQ